MISGIVLLTSLTFAAAPPSPALEPPSADVSALIARLRQPAPANTAYAEVHFVKMLQKPLQVRGELHYGDAGELGKRVDQPYRETTTIVNGQVEVKREGRPVQHFSLERAPELEALLASFSALLGGDAASLNRYYSIALEQHEASWRLILTPRSQDLIKKVSELIVDGRDTAPRCFSLHESDGDTSVMRLGALADATLPDPPTSAALDILCRSATP